MSTDIQLRCACGAVEGVLSEASPNTVNRCLCYCDDCQAFARFLGRDDIMDDRGGSDIIQMAPSRLRFTVGTDKLRVMRLSEKGVLRWYTDCCKVPAGNMLNMHRSPFSGVVTRMFVLQGSELDAVVGKPIGGIHGRFATGGCPSGIDNRASLRIIGRSVKWLAGNALNGRHKPSAYWTDDGKLKAELRTLSSEERLPLYRPG